MWSWAVGGSRREVVKGEGCLGQVIYRVRPSAASGGGRRRGSIAARHLVYLPITFSVRVTKANRVGIQGR